MTTGTLVFTLGIGLLIISLLSGVVLAVTYNGSRKKIQERMREKY